MAKQSSGLEPLSYVILSDGQVHPAYAADRGRNFSLIGVVARPSREPAEACRPELYSLRCDAKRHAKGRRSRARKVATRTEAGETPQVLRQPTLDTGQPRGLTGGPEDTSPVAVVPVLAPPRSAEHQEACKVIQKHVLDAAVHLSMHDSGFGRLGPPSTDSDKHVAANSHALAAYSNLESAAVLLVSLLDSLRWCLEPDTSVGQHTTQRRPSVSPLGHGTAAAASGQTSGGQERMGTSPWSGAYSPMGSPRAHGAGGASLWQRPVSRLYSSPAYPGALRERLHTSRPETGPLPLFGVPQAEQQQKPLSTPQRWDVRDWEGKGEEGPKDGQQPRQEGGLGPAKHSAHHVGEVSFRETSGQNAGVGGQDSSGMAGQPLGGEGSEEAAAQRGAGKGRASSSRDSLASRASAKERSGGSTGADVEAWQLSAGGQEPAWPASLPRSSQRQHRTAIPTSIPQGAPRAPRASSGALVDDGALAPLAAGAKPAAETNAANPAGGTEPSMTPLRDRAHSASSNGVQAGPSNKAAEKVRPAGAESPDGKLVDAAYSVLVENEALRMLADILESERDTALRDRANLKAQMVEWELMQRRRGARRAQT